MTLTNFLLLLTLYDVYPAATSGVFSRAWTAAQVTWDCNEGHGTILQN